ncbi:MAG: phage major capsid protein [Actinomycetota bacterium]
MQTDAEMKGALDAFVRVGAPRVGGPVGGKASDGEWATAFRKNYGRKALDITGSVSVPTPISGLAQTPGPIQFVADLIPAQPATGDTASYLQQTSRTNNAAPVAKGADKPESAYTLARVESPIATIAHVVSGIAKQDLDDAAVLAQFLEAEMWLGLRIEIDDQVLNGDGTDPDLTGILQTAGTIAVPFATDAITTLRKALTALQQVYVTPTGVVLNPIDAEGLDLVKASGSGTFYFGGPLQAGAEPIWGVTPVVVTPAIAAGVALMGDFAGGALLFARQDAEVAWNPFSGSNEVDVRAEARVGLGVLRPFSFAEWTCPPREVAAAGSVPCLSGASALGRVGRRPLCAGHRPTAPLTSDDAVCCPQSRARPGSGLRGAADRRSWGQYGLGSSDRAGCWTHPLASRPRALSILLMSEILRRDFGEVLYVSPAAAGAKVRAARVGDGLRRRRPGRELLGYPRDVALDRRLERLGYSSGGAGSGST